MSALFIREKRRYEARSRGVAQPGSAAVLGTVGRRFESYRPDHFHKSRSSFEPEMGRDPRLV